MQLVLQEGNGLLWTLPLDVLQKPRKRHRRLVPISSFLLPLAYYQFPLPLIGLLLLQPLRPGSQRCLCLHFPNWQLILSLISPRSVPQCSFPDLPLERVRHHHLLLRCPYLYRSLCNSAGLLDRQCQPCQRASASLSSTWNIFHLCVYRQLSDRYASPCG